MFYLWSFIYVYVRICLFSFLKVFIFWEDSSQLILKSRWFGNVSGQGVGRYFFKKVYKKLELWVHVMYNYTCSNLQFINYLSDVKCCVCRFMIRYSIVFTTSCMIVISRYAQKKIRPKKKKRKESKCFQ